MCMYIYIVVNWVIFWYVEVFLRWFQLFGFIVFINKLTPFSQKANLKFIIS